MPLAANSKLGLYEIKSPLGAGGMGEVDRARDSRLNRDVAVKVLRTDGYGGADRQSRFEREARAVAALNHPNIVAVYDFGIEQDQQYIVSKLLSFTAVGGEPDYIMNANCDICSLSPDGTVLAAFVLYEDGNPPPSLYISNPIGSKFVPYEPANFKQTGFILLYDSPFFPGRQVDFTGPKCQRTKSGDVAVALSSWEQVSTSHLASH